VIVDRLAEILLVQILRAHASSATDEAGFLAALADEALGRALTKIHQHPEQPHSVDALARAAGMSRTSFIAAFREKVQQSPMRYVTNWRMRHARDLLETGRSIAEIAAEVGYESEFAFAKAFKRVYGVPPGAMRRRAR
jgi:transcriptional regulator GlxA family with amidase domain